MGVDHSGTTVAPQSVRPRLPQQGVHIEEGRLVAIECMHEVCNAEQAGVEFLMLLLIVPTNLAERHGVLPQRLLRHLLKQAENTPEGLVMKDGEVAPEFVRDVSLYAQVASELPFYGRGLALREPGEACGVDLFRGFFCPQSPEDSELQIIAYVIEEMRALAILHHSEPVKLAVAHSRGSVVESGGRDGVAFALHVVGTTRTHAVVTDVLRRRSLRRGRALQTTGREERQEAAWCAAIAAMEGYWDGEFDLGPTPTHGAHVCSAQQFMAPSLLLYNGKDGGLTDQFTFLAPYDKPRPLQAYLPRVTELLDTA